jgi:hypothetical protein
MTGTMGVYYCYTHVFIKNAATSATALATMARESVITAAKFMEDAAGRPLMVVVAAFSF